MRKYADHELNLPARCFTGQEWANGTAQRIYRADYKKAVAELRQRDNKTPRSKKPHDDKEVRQAIEFDDYLDSRRHYKGNLRLNFATQK